MEYRARRAIVARSTIPVEIHLVIVEQGVRALSGRVVKTSWLSLDGVPGYKEGIQSSMQTVSDILCSEAPEDHFDHSCVLERYFQRFMQISLVRLLL
jgi:hypothetical protein